MGLHGKRTPWVVLLIIVAGYFAWPRLVIEPALRAEAQRDVLAANAIPLPMEGDTIPIRTVFVTGAGVRFVVVSNSHHNNYIGYSGSTYVNVNDSVYHRGQGHCDEYWIFRLSDLQSATQEQFEKALRDRRYELVR